MSNALDLKHVYKQYGDFAIRDLNLELPQGCVMGLVGENGAGKSTTIHMILDIVKPDSGEITVLGSPHGADFNRVKEDIGVVLDEPGFPLCLDARHVERIMAKTFRKWDSKVSAMWRSSATMWRSSTRAVYWSARRKICCWNATD